MPAIQGKVIAITGAGSGMGGEADALLLAGHGAKVVLGDIRENRLEKMFLKRDDSPVAVSSSGVYGGGERGVCADQRTAH